MLKEKKIYEYIYVREHESYKKYNACKIGYTISLAERDNTYSTNEILRGKFTLVIRIDGIISSNDKSYEQSNTSIGTLIEKVIHKYFSNESIYFDGGIEFFNIVVKSRIQTFLDTLPIMYTILQPEDIERLIKEYKLRKYINSRQTKITKILKIWLENIKEKKQIQNNYVIKPLLHQQQILDKIHEYYENNSICQIQWACGLGKALLSIFIIQKLGCNTVLFGVPSVYLQKQVKLEILRIYIGYEENILCVGGDDITSTNKLHDIKIFLARQSKQYPKFIITTYDSCELLTHLGNDYYFDMKIGDECHHLASIENNTNTQTYIKFHKILSRKTLFMTATQKNIQYVKKQDIQDNLKIYSMDDETLFGKIIDIKSIKWAIENNCITDFNVLVLYNTITEINNIIARYKIKNIKIKDIELFVSTFMTLKSICKYNDLTHILIYTNTAEHCDEIIEYIDILFEHGLIGLNKNDLYYKSLHSKIRGLNLQNEVNKFKNAKYGIISCIYIFGEGFSLPKLNGVTFAENMISPIRNTQCALRPNRLDRENPQKIAYIIIPYLDMEEQGISTKSFQKCFNILDNLRNTDETIEQKIIVASLTNNNSILDDSEINTSSNSNITNNSNILLSKNKWHLEITENKTELEKIKIKLKYSISLNSKNTPEKDEYEYVKLLNKQLKLKSNADYYKYKDPLEQIHHKHWIDNPDMYFTRYCVWVNWYDFLGIDTSKYCRDITEWRNFCLNIGITSLEDYNEKSKQHDELPKMPSQYYSHFRDIETELGLDNHRRT